MMSFNADSSYRRSAAHPSNDRTHLWGPTTAASTRGPASALSAPGPAPAQSPVDFNRLSQRPSAPALNNSRPQRIARRPEIQVVDFGEDPQLEAIRSESVQIERERQARFLENEQALLRTLAESQRVNERRCAEDARADQLLRQALEESQRGKARETEDEELQMVLAMSLSEHEFATTSAQRFAQLSFTAHSTSSDNPAQLSKDAPHSLFQNVIVDESSTSAQQPAHYLNQHRRRASLYDSFVVTNPDALVSPPAYEPEPPASSSTVEEVRVESMSKEHVGPIAHRALADTMRTTSGTYLQVPQRATSVFSSVPLAPASAFYSRAVAGAMAPNPPPVDKAPFSTQAGLLPSPAPHSTSSRRSSPTSTSELSDDHNSVRLSVLSTTSVAGSWASEASDDTLDETQPTSQSLSSLSDLQYLPMAHGTRHYRSRHSAIETSDDNVDPFDDRFASVDGEDMGAELPAISDGTGTDTSFESSSLVQDRDMFGVARRLSKESVLRPSPSISIIAPILSFPELRMSSSHGLGVRDEALATTPTQLDEMSRESVPLPKTPPRPALPRDEFDVSGTSLAPTPPTGPQGIHSASSSTDALDAYRTNPSSGGLVIDATAGGVALATKDIIEGVRWGFVRANQLAQHPPLDHDGPFQKAAQLSTYTDELSHERHFQCFAIEASSWHRLLCYLMWFGLSQFEAAPYDHAALTKDRRHFEVSLLVQFFRSFEDRTPRVRCHVQILPLAGASVMDAAPTIRSQVTFDASCPNISIPIDADFDRPLCLPLTLATLGSALSRAHTISSRLSRSTFGSSTSNRGVTVMEKTLASAVIFFKQLNGDFATASPEAEDFERSTLERLKLRLKRVRGKRVGVQGGRLEGARDDVPEEATLITPFVLEETEDRTCGFP
ncbi:BQ2448_4087 [Microbotryum intermedium]|uniref:BQ2448_4087 protein n=1 Tax=Microbotryum intermedium TaxID=269621 RepID=A0A238FFG6_9BASI|nr:BQ2448_4087 [Microbotryum intermedium]